ncbi:hypothetical protein DFO55_12420 [Grimontella sp. AG753]|nr:hypothetical protein DFO55_12420 [Grimontella sp. AG753]
MKKIALVIAASLVISGCDESLELIENSVYKVLSTGVNQSPYIVLQPGFRIKDHGKAATVFGYDNCPKTDFSYTRESGCVIINSLDKTVSVLVSNESTSISKPRQELWTVDRQGDQRGEIVRLKRPDNSFVIPFDER